MDTLDKILKTHPTPIHLRLHKGEFELVVVTEYPHGYDVSHRHIFSGVDEAFIKALEHPLSQESKPYAWRIYGFGQVKIAQSPNLHLWFPEDNKENHRLRKMLQAIVDYRTPMELRRLIGEAAKMLKELAKHG